MANSKFLLNQTEQSIPYVLFHDMAGSYVPSHWHKETEIIVCKKGKNKMVINSRVYDLEEGDIAVIPGGDTHLYFRAADHERMVVLFEYQLFETKGFQGIQRSELQKKLRLVPRTSRYWNAEDKQRVAEILEELEKLNTSNMFGRDLVIRARMFDLMFFLCNYIADEQAEEQNGKVMEEIEKEEESRITDMLSNLEKVFTYVEENYQKPIALKDAAEILGFSTSYFARFFKKYSGETFLNYLNAYRINKARDMLFMDNCSISWISEEVGIPNVKTFNRLFKQRIGTSPVMYRKSILGQK